MRVGNGGGEGACRRGRGAALFSVRRLFWLGTAHDGSPGGRPGRHRRRQIDGPSDSPSARKTRPDETGPDRDIQTTPTGRPPNRAGAERTTPSERRNDIMGSRRHPGTRQGRGHCSDTGGGGLCSSTGRLAPPGHGQVSRHVTLGRCALDRVKGGTRKILRWRVSHKGDPAGSERRQIFGKKSIN